MMVFKRGKSNIVEKTLVVTGHLGDVFCCFTTVQEMAGGVFKAIGSVLHVYLNQGGLLYTSDAADERSSVDLGGRRIIKKKKKKKKKVGGVGLID